MKKVFGIFITLFSVHIAAAQYDLTYNRLHTKQPKSIARLSFFTPKLEVEQKQNEHTSIVLSIWSGINYQTPYAIESSSLTDFNWSPGFTLEPRYYPGLPSRAHKGKNIVGFCGTYMSFPISFRIKENRLSLGPKVGFQNRVWNLGYYNIGLGIGAQRKNELIRLAPILDFSLGFLIFQTPKDDSILRYHNQHKIKKAKTR